MDTRQYLVPTIVKNVRNQAIVPILVPKLIVCIAASKAIVFIHNLVPDTDYANCVVNKAILKKVDIMPIIVPKHFVIFVKWKVTLPDQINVLIVNIIIDIINQTGSS
jgi:hypothetical protein